MLHIVSLHSLTGLQDFDDRMKLPGHSSTEEQNTISQMHAKYRKYTTGGPRTVVPRSRIQVQVSAVGVACLL